MYNKYKELIELLKKTRISKIIKRIDHKIREQLNEKDTLFNKDVYIKYFKGHNEELFTNFETEPANVSQLKKLLNGLYYARIAFEDVERIDTSSPKTLLEGTNYLRTKTAAPAYKACHLLTH